LERARAERLRADGLDPFQARALPESVLRFKQGFGRLIRSQEDRGYVTILDSRLLGRNYGRVFLQALPDCPIVRMVENQEIPLPPLEGDLAAD
jgi:ATP-dependent DNA helicase DinG